MMFLLTFRMFSATSILVSNVILMLLLVFSHRLRAHLTSAMVDLSFVTAIYGALMLVFLRFGPHISIETLKNRSITVLHTYQSLAYSDTIMVSSWVLCLVICWLIKRRLANQMVSKPGASAKVEDCIKSNKTAFQGKRDVYSTDSQCDANDKEPESSRHVQVHVLSALNSLTQAFQRFLTSSQGHDSSNIADSRQLYEAMRILRDEMKIFTRLPEQFRTLMDEVNELKDIMVNREIDPSDLLLTKAKVNVVKVTEKDASVPYVSAVDEVKSNKRTRPTVDSEPLNDDNGFNINDFQGKSYREVYEALRAKIFEERQRSREPEYLTKEERDLARMDLAALARLWKSKNPRAIITDYDRRNIGYLTEAEADLPRRTIKQFISDQKRKAWIQAERDAGREIKTCSQCNLMFPAGKSHRCIPTGWILEHKSKGLPEKKDVLISQTGKDMIRITRKSSVDQDKLAKQMEQFKSYQMRQDKRAEIGNLEPVPKSFEGQEISDIHTSGQGGVPQITTLDSPMEVHHVRADFPIESIAQRVVSILKAENDCHFCAHFINEQPD